jgi:hypothetical protein
MRDENVVDGHGIRPVLARLAALAVMFGLSLAPGSVLAHEQDYDNSKPPHESPHRAEPPAGGHDNLGEAARQPGGTWLGTHAIAVRKE